MFAMAAFFLFGLWVGNVSHAPSTVAIVAEAIGWAIVCVVMLIVKYAYETGKRQA
jgi:hypothetical protein